MDYCHPCQRHLNGALACAGCGTPADALVPYAGPAYSGHEPEAPRETLEPAGAGGHRRRARAAAQGRGRRAHRRRGRGVLLAALGVLLAVGALSLAELAIEPGGDDGAADYVSESTASATEAAPDPSASTVLDDAPGSVDAPTAVPVSDSGSAESGGDPSGSPEPGGPAPSTSASAAPDEDPPAGSTPSAPDDTEPPVESQGPEPTDGPTQPEPPEEDPEPTPSPTETCTRWLWFCT
ncbi:SCO2400 family protein [Streptomyces sp. NPDC004980]